MDAYLEQRRQHRRVLETITKKDDGSYTYRVGKEERPLVAKKIVVPYKSGERDVRRRSSPPIARIAARSCGRPTVNKWVSVRLMEEPMKALIQSFSRTKARNLAEYKKVMEAHTNSSNNTLYADADGNIAYLHSNFIPKRDPKFDWTKPVDGSNPATEWNGVLSFDESPNVVNPPNGWVYNTNNYPFSAAGPQHSPRQKDFPAYVDSGSENPRGIHAIRVLDGKKGFTVDSLVGAAYDSLLPEFESSDSVAAEGVRRRARVESAEEQAGRADCAAQGMGLPLGGGVGADLGGNFLRRGSVAARHSPRPARPSVSVYEYMRSRATAQQRLESLAAGVDKLHGGLRQVADAVGRHQPLPAQRRRRSCRSSTTASRARR